jgi:hypothetical protein
MYRRGDDLLDHERHGASYCRPRRRLRRTEAWAQKLIDSPGLQGSVDAVVNIVARVNDVGGRYQGLPLRSPRHSPNQPIGDTSPARPHVHSFQTIFRQRLVLINSGRYTRTKCPHTVSISVLRRELRRGVM